MLETHDTQSNVSLANALQEGVKFQSPHDQTEMLLTPEQSIAIQNTIGADIIMQLDDVVHVLTTGARVEEAMYRSVRWLDRCIEAHKRTQDQNLFGIIQGGLQPELRKKCIEGTIIWVVSWSESSPPLFHQLWWREISPATPLVA